MEKSQYALILWTFSPCEKRKHCIFLTDISTMLSSCHHHLISSISIRKQKMGSRTSCQRIVHYQDSFLLLRVRICLTVFQVLHGHSY